MENEKMVTRDKKEINLCVWQAKEPKAVLVLVHGAAEHIYRYKHFAQFLADNGINVIGYNHIGHGDNKASNHEGVYFGAENGDEIIVNDLEDVCFYAYQQNPNLPLYVMGHSMGSIVTRVFAIKTRINVDGIIICGTVNPSAKLLKPARGFAKFLYKIFGKERYSKKLNKMVFGTFENQISYNKNNIQEYSKDENCGIMFTNKSIFDLINLMQFCIGEQQVTKMQRTDYLIISGSEDPFSNDTKDLESFVGLMSKNEFNYKYKKYSGMKHEILNEDEKDMVYLDILNFILKGERNV